MAVLTQPESQEQDFPQSSYPEVGRTRAHKRPGFLLFNRPPRLWEAVEDSTIRLASPPVPPSASRSNLVTSLGMPALSFVVMVGISFLVLSAGGTGMGLIFIVPMMAMSAVYLIGAVWSVADEHFSSRKLFRQQTADYREVLADVERTLAFRTAQEQQIRNELDPPVDILIGRAANPLQPNSRLWERRQFNRDFLRIRFGLGPVRSATQVQFEAPPKPTELSREAETVIARYGILASAPLLVDLKEVASVGIAGPVGPANSMAIAMLCGVLFNHSPHELRVLAIFPPSRADAWEWLRWAPHTEEFRTANVGERMLASTPERAQHLLRQLQDEISARERRLAALKSSAGADASDNPGLGPNLLVILDGDDLIPDSVLVETLLANGPQLRVYTICLARSVALLPSGCGGVIHVGNTPQDPVELRTVLRGERLVGTMDVASPRAAEMLARALSPLQIAAIDRTNGIPDQVRLLDLFRIDDPAEADIWAYWTGSIPKSLYRHEHLRIPVGQGAGESILHVSLQSGSPDGGPHGIVGGMTGSGKSELLRSVVAAFAITHHPHKLNFVLIDYKGGSAFQGLEALPHVVGFVTNLDEHLAERALVALKSELNERMHRLAQAGVDSVSAYQELMERDPARGLAPLPNLVLVIDEFAQLKEEVPDFIHGLINIARVGRSLGVHLLLATQKPSGVVTDEIRANTSYKICLRVAENSDSTEVIGSVDAALLPRTVPGRAFIQVGSEGIVAFQTARITTRYSHSITQTNAQIEEFSPSTRQSATLRDGATGSAPTTAHSGMFVQSRTTTELQAIVKRISEVAEEHGVGGLRPPWPPPLPNGIVLEEVVPSGRMSEGNITQPGAATAKSHMWPAQPPEGWLVAPVGLLDDPAHQRQDPFLLNLRQVGHVIAYGMTRTGKSTFLRTAAISLALSHTPNDLHLYCLDFGRGALTPLRALPHCGDLIFPTDVEKARRLLSDLRAEMTERTSWLQRVGVFNLAEYRASTRRPSGAPHFAFILVLLDNFASFRDTLLGDNALLDSHVSEELLADLITLIRDGSPAGIHFLITADSWNVISRYTALVNAIDTRIAFKQADDGDFSYVGLRLSEGVALPPGRGFVSGAAPLECQIAIPARKRKVETGDPGSRRADYMAWVRAKMMGQAVGPRPAFDEPDVPVEWMTGEEQTAALEEICSELAASWTGGGAPQVRELPPTVRLEELLASAHTGRRFASPVALADDNLLPIEVELTSESPVYLVAGPPKSGRSTLLLSTLLGLTARHKPEELQIVIVAFRRSPLWELERLPHAHGRLARDATKAGELFDWLQAEVGGRQGASQAAEKAPRILVAIDDLEEILLDDSVPIYRLVEAARKGRTLGVTLLAAGLNQELNQRYDDLTRYLKNSQTGFLLRPNFRDDGDILGLRLPMLTHRTFPPGRGFFCRQRSWQVAQVATPSRPEEELSDTVGRWLDVKTPAAK